MQDADDSMNGNSVGSASQASNTQHSSQTVHQQHHSNLTQLAQLCPCNIQVATVLIIWGLGN
jgi:hypothetical protein